MKKMMMIGNGHLDPVWLWQWQEGYHEIKATFRSALDRLQEFPGCIFTSACAGYYQWVEENDPAMFAEIRARVLEGRWAVVGGMWVQPDMNAPCGESFARHLLLSQRYFQEKFGRIARTGYNVDSFGHNAMMPQIYRRAGIENYVWMRPSKWENGDIPRGTMWWESPDGSRVMAYRIPDEIGGYSCFFNVPEKVASMFALANELDQPVMCFYGIGNHGGGPSVENLEQITQLQANHPQKEEIIYASPDDFFDGVRSSGIELPVWKNELQHHASGCYSTHSISKLRHRQAENALLRMEKLGVLSCVLTGHKHKAAFVQQAWHNLLFNEFHDVMGGCSLPESMADAVIQLDESISIAAREENAALQKISWQIDTSKGVKPDRSKHSFWLWGNEHLGTPVVVFNPHAFETTGPVIVRQPLKKVEDHQGQSVPVQIIRASRTNGKDDRWDSVFEATVPPMGYRLYWVYLNGEADTPNPLSVSVDHLENAHVRAEFDPSTGALCRLVRKDTGVNVMGAPTRTVLTDISAADTWAHNIFRFDIAAGEFGDATVTVLEEGPVRATLRVDSHHGASKLSQFYTLYADTDQLEVSVRMQLSEKHRMVKLCFPTAFEQGRKISEIAFGALERTACGNEEHCQRWIAMEGENAGLAVLNDGKYSYSAQDGELRLTIANTSIFADHYGQSYRDNSCQFMDQDEQRFTYVLCPYNGRWQQNHLEHRAALLNQPMPWVVETYHTGPLGSMYQGISLDNHNVSMSAFKRAEDDQGYVLRIHETTGQSQSCTVDVPMLGRQAKLQLGPWEIRTLYLPDDAMQSIKEVLLTEFDA